MTVTQQKPAAGSLRVKLNQSSPAHIMDSANSFLFEERQACIVMKAKILNVMDEY